MKKFIVLACAAVLVFGVAGVASAYQFEDMIDDWTIFGLDAVPILQPLNPFQYHHDLNDDVDFAAGDLVTEAFLELDFTNEEGDDYGVKKKWIPFIGVISIPYDQREYVSYAFDGDK